ncbi:MAG: DUF3293 domain-containing protein [Deltaproteobacteria bacterium]
MERRKLALGDDDVPPAPALEALLEAYRRTRYLVSLPAKDGAGAERIEIRLGVPNPRLAAFLARERLSCFAILSAYNPGLERPSCVVNARAHERLLADLRGYRCWAVVGVGEDGFREPGLFVGDLAEGEARAVGVRFRQLAIVCGAPAREPRLLRLDRADGE